ncbi:hypothetical protein ACN47E_000140 [Coniothyrium glycines]
MAPQSQSLDHLILFLPLNPTTSLPQIPPFLSQNFTLTPGGFHADGATSNTLILLADGCYMELISFVDTAKAATHWWGPSSAFVGWKDWCLTNALTAGENFELVGETHAEPVEGGRKRADGVDVKWAVTFPKGERGGQGVRGRVPFFCHDVTPRDVRVPLAGENITHKCGVLGVRSLSVVVKDEGVMEVTRVAYERLFGEVGKDVNGELHYQAGQVKQVDGLHGATIILRLAKSEEERKKVESTGFWYGDVVLSARARDDKVAGTREKLDKEDSESRGVSGLWIEYV